MSPLLKAFSDATKAFGHASEAFNDTSGASTDAFRAFSHASKAFNKRSVKGRCSVNGMFSTIQEPELQGADKFQITGPDLGKTSYS